MRQRVISISLALTFLLAGLSACKNEPEIKGRKARDWISLLRHQDLSVQEQASKALADMGEASIPYLKPALKANDPAIRRRVVITLGKLGAVAKNVTGDLLRRLSFEKAPIIRESILEALIQIDPSNPVVQAGFRKRLKDDDMDVRRVAQKGLDAIKPKEPEKKRHKAIPVPMEKMVLRKELISRLNEQPFALLAEVSRGNRRAAIVYLLTTTSFSLQPVAFVFEKKEDKSWSFLEKTKPFSDHGSSSLLSRALGGSDRQRVIRPCGVEADGLVEHVSQHGKTLALAVAAGELSKASESLEQLGKSFSFSLLVYEQVLSDLLMNQAFEVKWQLASSEKSAIYVTMTSKGKRRKARLFLGPCGQGVMVVKID
jgi:hypothetical protein